MPRKGLHRAPVRYRRWLFPGAHLPASSLKPRLDVSCFWQRVPHSEQPCWAGICVEDEDDVVSLRWREQGLSEEHTSQTSPGMPRGTEGEEETKVSSPRFSNQLWESVELLTPGRYFRYSPPHPLSRDQSSEDSHTVTCLSPALLLRELSSSCSHRQIWVVTVSLQFQTLAVEWAPYIADGAVTMQVPGPPQSCRMHISPGSCRHVSLGYVPGSRVTTRRRDASSSLLNNVKLVFQISCTFSRLQ